ncbi:hypothetical protein NHX12_019504 [Muraenolepis orangiensis]|uniref:DDE Tnp4 domain-containing protein n=1 Tax=Muraenolepis orangiensis TaxID=630683 RepID=A0A9Q0IW40_9TELE|nr:hypothetical protein NHX12_019504 [Muraenolepis orangiensis]
MNEDDRVRTLMFTMTYMLMKRRRDVTNMDVQRRNEIQRRIRHRQYFLQRQKRMLMMMTVAGGLSSSVSPGPWSGGVRGPTRPWTSTQTTDWWERVVAGHHEGFQPCDWLDKFRMSRRTFFHLCDRLRPRLARQDTRLRAALPVEKRVAVALWRLASNVEYRVISELFGVGKSTVCGCVRDLCHAVALLLRPLHLRCPPGEAELRDSAGRFLADAGFPHCGAVVATLHTAIITPSANPSEYANSDGLMSVMTQVCINGQGQFWDVCGSFPGGTDPAEVLQNSTLWAHAAEGELSPEPPPLFMGRPLRYVLLGDGSHPLQPWLLKAYPEAGTGTVPALPQHRRTFNRRLEGARRLADDALLRLRSRWQCLSKRNDCGLDLVSTMVLACCILHNVCESRGDAFRPEWREEAARAETRRSSARPRSAAAAEPEGRAEDVRRLFCDYFQQQEGPLSF